MLQLARGWWGMPLEIALANRILIQYVHKHMEADQVQVFADSI